MELRSYFRALRKHWLTLLLVTILGVLAAAAAYLLTPPRYSSSVTFYVSTPLTDGSNPLNAGQFAQARVNSYVEVLQSEELARRVIEDRNLALTPADITRRVDATAQLNTVLVTAVVEDTDRRQALTISRGIATAFPELVDELDNKGRRADVVTITTVSGPTLLPSAVAPDWRLYGALGLLGGLALGGLLAVAREALDTTVRTTDTASDLLGGPVLGVIDFDPDSTKSPLLLKGSKPTGRAEALRQLRTNLQFVDATSDTEVMLITSAVPGEGKSLTSVNLALSFAEFGERVLLVDADLRRPTLATYLGVGSDVGLSGVLAGTSKPEQAIQPWGTDGLHVLPSGRLPPNPAELLGSRAMGDLISKVRTDFDRVIIDAPPLLPVTDAALVSAYADGVVMVIRWGKTHRSQVTAAVDALAQVSAPLLGGVLNMRRLSRSERHTYAAREYYGS